MPYCFCYLIYRIYIKIILTNSGSAQNFAQEGEMAVNFFSRLILVCFLALTVNANALELRPAKFTIYAFIPWTSQKFDNYAKLSNYLNSFGIRPIRVIYENDFFTQGEIDPQKLRKIAEETVANPNIPISFDLEFGDRFKPETVIPRIESLLRYYHAYQPKALVGIYGTIPQNTYSWKPTISTYDRLNDQYMSLVNLVDFLSPVLYNYDGNNFSAWLKSAKYNINAAKQYASKKPIIPFISPIIRVGETKLVKKGHLVEELDEIAMRERLQALYALGASGCIIWASSQDRTKDGQIPSFDPNNAWGKAVVEFIKTH